MAVRPDSDPGAAGGGFGCSVRVYEGEDSEAEEANNCLLFWSINDQDQD
jgi:hypothetical protein